MTTRRIRVGSPPMPAHVAPPSTPPPFTAWAATDDNGGLRILGYDYDDAAVAPTDVIALHLADDDAEAAEWRRLLARGIVP